LFLGNFIAAEYNKKYFHNKHKQTTMPTRRGKDRNGTFYQYGDIGKRYYYKTLAQGEIARQKAIKQGQAIEINRHRTTGRGTNKKKPKKSLKQKKKKANQRGHKRSDQKRSNKKRPKRSNKL
jgi:hypothetical protein